MQGCQAVLSNFQQSLKAAAIMAVKSLRSLVGQVASRDEKSRYRTYAGFDASKAEVAVMRR